MAPRRSPGSTAKASHRPKTPHSAAGSSATLDHSEARALWFDRQALAVAVKGGVADVLRRAGWMIAAGGAGPHLSLRARLRSFNRTDADRAIAEFNGVVEVPALRGTSMLVPEEDAADALRCARRFHDEAFARLTRACRVTEQEIDRLSDAVLGKLESETLGVDELREALPGKLVRALGEPGRKLGEGSTLTVALKRLRVRGKILRVTLEGRLDSTRFAYAIAPASMRRGRSADEPVDPELHVRLAHRFFRWAGPATTRELAWWAGLGRKEAQDGIRRAGLGAVRVEGWAEEAWIARDDPRRQAPSGPACRSNTPSGAAGRFTFLPFRDNYVGMRRGLAPIVALEDRGVKVLDWNGKPSPVGDAESLHHHAILSGDRLAGIWEWDPDARRVVYASFGRLTPSGARDLAEEADRVSNVIAEEIGDLKFYSLDNEKNRRVRLDAVEKLRA